MVNADIFTLKELALYLKLAEKTAYRLAAEGKLPGFKVGGAWRFRKAEIDRWIVSGGAKLYRRSGGIVRLRRHKSVPRERVSFSLKEHRLKGGEDVQRGDIWAYTACLSRRGT